MTDIVDRLRAYRMDVDSPDVVLEAADEIERLRLEIENALGMLSAFTEWRIAINPELIKEQRAKGWPDWHPEDYCHKCGHRNIVPWYADSALWNQAAPVDAIWCPQCFVEAYEQATGERPVWRLAPAESSDERSALIQSEAAMRHRLDEALEEKERQIRPQ